MGVIEFARKVAVAVVITSIIMGKDKSQGKAAGKTEKN